MPAQRGDQSLGEAESDLPLAASEGQLIEEVAHVDHVAIRPAGGRLADDRVVVVHVRVDRPGIGSRKRGVSRGVEVRVPDPRACVVLVVPVRADAHATGDRRDGDVRHRAEEDALRADVVDGAEQTVVQRPEVFRPEEVGLPSVRRQVEVLFGGIADLQACHRAERMIRAQHHDQIFDTAVTGQPARDVERAQVAVLGPVRGVQDASRGAVERAFGTASQ